MRRGTTIRGCTCLLLLAGGLPPTSLAAQAKRSSPPGIHLQPIEQPEWLGPSGLLLANVLLGGLSTGLVRELRGGSFLRGFAAGSTAGGIVFLGKHTAAQEYAGAGLLGRELAAMGGSIARNAAAGQPWLRELELPVGPARLLVDTRTGRIRGRIDPVAAGVLLYASFSSRYRFDGRASLSSGMPVFLADRETLVDPWSGSEACGLEISSVILLADMRDFNAVTRGSVLAHERVHALQGDSFQAYWGRPLLEWLLPGSKSWQGAGQLIDLNLGEALVEGTNQLLLRHPLILWEVEAEHIGRGLR